MTDSKKKTTDKSSSPIKDSEILKHSEHYALNEGDFSNRTKTTPTPIKSLKANPAPTKKTDNTN